jgi:hypothetical protein
MALRRLLLIPVAVLTLTLVLSTQTAKPSPTPKPPQLTLEIIPVKKAYVVGETLFVKYKLTSLADGTLCFPPPEAESHVSVTGYLLTDANPLSSDEKDKIIEVYDARYPTDEELRSNVTTRWIKLGMSEPYRPRESGRVAKLTAPGEWVLSSTYYPPELPTGQKAIVESLGCTPPVVEVHSTPVTITVSTSPK